MSKSQRSATLTPQKGSQVSINRPARSQTANKNKSFLMVTTLDQSKVKPIGKLKPKAQYHIIDSFIKDDKIAYMGECQGKKKVFNRSAFLTNNQLFGQLIRYYEVQVLEMVKNLDSQREGQAKNNL